MCSRFIKYLAIFFVFLILSDGAVVIRWDFGDDEGELVGRVVVGVHHVQAVGQLNDPEVDPGHHKDDGDAGHEEAASVLAIDEDDRGQAEEDDGGEDSAHHLDGQVREHEIVAFRFDPDDHHDVDAGDEGQEGHYNGVDGGPGVSDVVQRGLGRLQRVWIHSALLGPHAEDLVPLVKGVLHYGVGVPGGVHAEVGDAAEEGQGGQDEGGRPEGDAAHAARRTTHC